MIDVFEKIESVKTMVHAIYPDMGLNDTKLALSRIRKYLRGQVEVLTEEEEVINDVLIQNGVKAATAYSWYRVLNFPDYLQRKLKRREISFRQAFAKNLENNRPREILAAEVRREILNYVEKLAERDFLRGGEYALK